MNWRSEQRLKTLITLGILVLLQEVKKPKFLLKWIYYIFSLSDPTSHLNVGV